MQFFRINERILLAFTDSISGFLRPIGGLATSIGEFPISIGEFPTSISELVFSGESKEKTSKGV